MTIFKYTLDGSPVTISLPRGAKILSVAEQNERVVLWAMVDPKELALQERVIQIFGTGHPIEDAESLTFIGTVLMHKGKLVWHIFEVNQ